MHTTQHSSTRCQVLLHPAAATNPDAVRAVQRATGCFILLQGGKPRLASQPLTVRFHDEIDLGPFGGDAA